MSNAYFQAAMSEYLAEEARAADMAPLHEQMFGHALEPDPDFSSNGVETDYPGGPLVIEKSGADEAVRSVIDDYLYGVWFAQERERLDDELYAAMFPERTCDIVSITRDIARGG